jgi:hypothetical protein
MCTNVEGTSHQRLGYFGFGKSDPDWSHRIELFTRIKVGCGFGSAGILPTGSDLAFPAYESIPAIGRLDSASAQGQEAMKQSFEECSGDHLHVKERGRAILIHWVFGKVWFVWFLRLSCDYPTLVPSEAEKKLKICSAFDLCPSAVGNTW